MRKPLLIEIGTEELPAIPFLKELPYIKEKWIKILKNSSLLADFKFDYTPRRLVLISDAFLQKQPDTTHELFGAPVEIAYKDGLPTNAAFGFAKKCGVDISEITTTTKNSKEVLYFQKKVLGKSSKELLPKMITQFLKDLNFGKSMRWGERDESFIRPIRWIGCMLGDEIVHFNIYGQESKSLTYGHRTHTYKALSYDSIDSYHKLLKKNSVILSADERKERILSQFEEIEKNKSVTIEMDQELLDEVVAITEYPTALYGSFDENFLKLPPEVIIVSMKEHQRYFPIYKDKKLSNHFVFVSNADTDDYSKIIKGNEKVLHPRLSDALFFYENDLKKGLDNEGLKKVSFMQGLGSIYDKSQREAKVAEYLCELYIKDEREKKLIHKAVMYAKSDLLTDMVYEFTELQGVMGYYYAKEAKEDKNVAISYKEQYLPDGDQSNLPSSDFSAIVALSYKIDTILALFSQGKIPTGTKDPYALRRAAVGIIKIVLDRGFSFDIYSDLKALISPYDDFDFELLEKFFLERLSHFFDANTSVIGAVLKTKERDIVEISKKIEALDKIVKKEDFKESFSTFKRVANIIKDIDQNEPISIDEKLFEHKEESILYGKYQSIACKKFKSYTEKLEGLFGLKIEIDNFFDNVLVNAKDEKIKDNRKNLIALIYQSFKDIADIKEITI